VLIKTLISIALAGMAATSSFAQQTGEPAAASASSPEAAPGQTTTAQAGTVPKPVVVWDCGNCEHNEKVPPLIEEAFRAEALRHGRAISATETVELRIHQFRQRNPGARVMFGFMAGRDSLGVKFVHKGKEAAVSDYSANVMQGMNAVSQSVGARAYAKLVTLHD
jgi:hypothetical protein